MAVLYKLHKIVRTFKDGRTDKANNKWFARAITVGTTDTDKLADIIQEKCTLTKADIKGCIEALISAIRDQCQNSYAVKLEGLGTFKIGLKTKGAESVGEFSVQSNIVGSHVIFYPARTVDPATGKQNIALLSGMKVKETPLNTVIKDYPPLPPPQGGKGAFNFQLLSTFNFQPLTFN